MAVAQHLERAHRRRRGLSAVQLRALDAVLRLVLPGPRWAARRIQLLHGRTRSTSRSRRTLSLGNYKAARSPGLSTGSFWCARSPSGSLVALIVLTFSYAFAYISTFAFPEHRELLLFLVLASLFSGYLVRIYAWRTILGEEGLVNSALRDARPDRRAAAVPRLQPLRGRGDAGRTSSCRSPSCRSTARCRTSARRARGGAGPRGRTGRTSFRTVTLPLTLTGLRVAFAFAFVLACGDYVHADAGRGARTGSMIGNVIADQFGVAFNWPLGAALAIVTLAIVLVVYGLAGLIVARSRRDEPRPQTLRCDAGPPAASSPRWSRSCSLPVVAHRRVLVQRVAAAELPDQGLTAALVREAPGRRPLLGRAAQQHHARDHHGDRGRRAGHGRAPSAFAACRLARQDAIGSRRSLPAVVPALRASASPSRSSSMRSASVAERRHRPDRPCPDRAAVRVPDHARPARSRSTTACSRPRATWAPRPRARSETSRCRSSGPSILGAALISVALSLDEFVITSFTIGSDQTLPVLIWGRCGGASTRRSTRSRR